MIYYKPKVGKIVEYFPREEADKNQLQYIPWRDATKEGQWILSDDDIVLQVKYVRYITELQKGSITPRVRRRIVTELGVRYPHGKAPFNVKEHIKTKNYGIIPRTWWKGYQKKYPTLNRELANLVITHAIHMNSRHKYDRKEYAVLIKLAKKIFIKDKTWNWYQLRTYFNHDEVRMEIQEEIKSIAKERGYTVKKVFDLLDKAETYGTEKKDGKIMLAMAKEVAAIVGMSRKLPSVKTIPELPATDQEDLPGSDSAFDAILDRQPEKVSE